jgi:MraZ protein
VLFAGEFEGRVDSRRRIAVPAVFAEALSGDVVVARGFERCVAVYSAEGSERVAAEIGEMPITNAESRRLARFIFASAFEQQPDRQGRIEQPKSVLSYANIEQDVTVIGTGDSVEIWDRASWKAELGELQTQVTRGTDTANAQGERPAA